MIEFGNTSAITSQPFSLLRSAISAEESKITVLS